MATYCTPQDGTAIVNMSKNGKPFQIKSNNLPLTITCKNNDYSLCQKVNVTYSCRFWANDISYSDVTKTTILFAPVNGIRTQKTSVTYDPSKKIQVAISSHGGANFQGNQCNPSTVWAVVEDASAGSGWYTGVAINSIAPVNGNPNPNSKGVKIIDSTGTLIFDDDLIACNWSVQCGECPPGTEKHTISEYPGYCCFDCSTIKSEIKGITALVRSLNNG